MILRHASGGAARCLAAASSARPPALPRLLLRLQARHGGDGDGDATSRAVAAVAAGPTASAGALSPADRHALIDLIHRFDDCLNRGRHDDLGAFFVGGGGGGVGGEEEEASTSSPLVATLRVRQPGAASFGVHARGVPAVVAYFRACAPAARGHRHLVLNSVVEEGVGQRHDETGQGEEGRAGAASSAATGAAAVGRARVRSARLLVTATTPPELRASGVIEDVMVRAPGGEWRLLSRDLIMDPPAAAA